MGHSRRVQLPVCRLSVCLLALLSISLLACASQSIEFKRPEIRLQGYVLALIPSDDPAVFLGHRYDPASGELGDQPCKMSAPAATQSQQRLVATLSDKDLASLKLGHYKVLTSDFDVKKLEGIRVELRTTRRAFVVVDSDCKQPVIYEVLAGTLFVEYQFDSHVSIGADAELLRTFGGEASTRYVFDRNRNVIQDARDVEQFVAFRVQNPNSAGTVGIGLLAAGGAALVGGAISDGLLAKDGKDSPVEWIPVALYATSAAAVITGLVLWLRR